MKRLVVYILLAFTFVSSISAEKVIATATLHITLFVPPSPITADTEPGEYGEYTVEKDADVLYIAAK